MLTHVGLAHGVPLESAPGRDVGSGSRVVGQDLDAATRRQVSGQPRQSDDGQGAFLAARVEVVAAHRRSVPSCARTVLTASGRTVQKRSTSCARWGATADVGSVIRTFPWVTAPMAASTWLGSRVSAVHAEPLATAKPRRLS